MAAASGSRDGSGPINGTGFGPTTGLGALATVDFACAAVSFAADVRSPLVSASFGAAGCLFGGTFFAATFLAAFFAGAFLAALAGAFLAGAFFAAFAGILAAGAGGSVAFGTGPGLGADDASAAAGAAASGFSSGRSCWSAIWLLLCACVVYPAVAPIMPGRKWRLTGHGQCGRQRQRDGHERQ